MWWIKELLTSVRFLTIRSENGFWKSKRVYEFVAPALFALMLAVVYYFGSEEPAGKSVGRVLSNVFSFMVFVVPFHLAALGAFSTFQRANLDERLKGINAEIRVWSNEDNEYYWKSLTLRQYVSLLFGYLCTLGLSFVGGYILLSPLASIINRIMCNEVVGAGLLGVAVFFILHYLLLSIYAITFIFDKVNDITTG